VRSCGLPHEPFTAQWLLSIDYYKKMTPAINTKSSSYLPAEYSSPRKTKRLNKRCHSSGIWKKPETMRIIVGKLGSRRSIFERCWGGNWSQLQCITFYRIGWPKVCFWTRIPSMGSRPVQKQPDTYVNMWSYLRILCYKTQCFCISLRECLQEAV
jgi:hypothetical protein